MKPTMRLDFEYRGGPKDGEGRTFEIPEGDRASGRRGAAQVIRLNGSLDVLDEFSDRLPVPVTRVHRPDAGRQPCDELPIGRWVGLGIYGRGSDPRYGSFWVHAHYRTDDSTGWQEFSRLYRPSMFRKKRRTRSMRGK